MLPARTTIGANEALDSFLERVALANGITTTQLTAIATPSGVDRPWSFAMIDPEPRLLTRLSSLTGLTQAALRGAALARFDGGLPLDLTGFERQGSSSFRTLSARGWFPLHGTQACPMCISETGMWDLRWRLPFVATCANHGCYLVPTCNGCGRRFRHRNHTLLRRIRSIEKGHCGNQASARTQCTYRVSDNPVHAATPEALAITADVMAAFDGAYCDVCGQRTASSDYLAGLRSLTVLMTHIATLSAPEHAVWAEVIRDEAARRRTEHRGPRWGIRPPDDPWARGEVLAEANALLSCADVGTAAARLSEWLAHIPSTQIGPAGWIKNRIPSSSLVNELVEQALRERQSTSRRLAANTAEIGLPDSAIPQVIPLELYQDTLGTVIDASPDTGRRFASLCLAKLNAPGRTWSRAAEVLGQPAETGRRTPRALTHKMTATVDELSPLLTSIRDGLIDGPNYRDLESVVRDLAAEPESWFPAWAHGQTPTKRPGTLPYAITWLWTAVALADLDCSPAWPRPSTRQQKAYYRAYTTRMTPTVQASLRAVMTAKSVGRDRGQAPGSGATHC